MTVLSLSAAITAAALALRPIPSPEAPEARAARMGVIGEAISAAANRATCAPPWDEIDAPCRRHWPGSAVELSAVLLGLGYLESGFAPWVHAGKCRIAIGECDAGRARSPWQLQRAGYSATVWHELEGTGEIATFTAAWAAARTLASARRFCSYRARSVPWLPATVSVYATGSSCTYPRAQRRAQFVIRLEARIRQQLERDDS